MKKVSALKKSIAVIESTRRAKKHDWSYDALHTYSTHIVADPDDPDGYERAARCLETEDGLVAGAVVFHFAVYTLDETRGRTLRYIKNHATTSRATELWNWVDKTGDEIILLGLLYAVFTAERSNYFDLGDALAGIARHLRDVVPDCKDTLFQRELYKLKHCVQEEEKKTSRSTVLLKRDGSEAAVSDSDVDPGKSIPKRRRRSRVRLWG